MARTTDTSPAPQSFGSLAAIAVVVAVFALAVYWPALHNGFVNWDDPAYVYQRPEIRDLDGEFVAWAFTTTEHATWHPLTWLSLAVDYHFWQLRPFGYHLTNAVLHGLNSALAAIVAAALFWSRRQVLDSAALFGCAGVGLLFAVHPYHVESVAWISSRKDVLYGLFWLLATLAYLRYASPESGNRRGIAYGLCLLLFAGALLSKPMAITFPAVLLVLDWYPLRRFAAGPTSVRTALVDKIPFVVLSFGAALLTFLAAQRAEALGAMAETTFGQRLWLSVHAVGGYLAKTLVPLGLVPYYPLDLDFAPFTLPYIASLIAVAGVTLAAWALRRRAPVVGAAWLYFLATLGPTLGFVRFGSHAAADRYMYLPILGPLMLAGVGAVWLWRRYAPARPTLSMALILVGLVMAYLTRNQIAIWQDSITLWTHVVTHTQPDPKPFYNLGNAYKDAGNMAGARDAWARVVEIEPNHSLALNQLGNLAMLSERPQRAREYYAAAVAADEQNAEAHYNLAVVLERLGERGAARREYERFVEIAPAEYADVAARVKRKLAGWAEGPP